MLTDMTTRTPMKLAVTRSNHIDREILSKVFDSFRLLTDSMYFLAENGDGWDILLTLCDQTTHEAGDTDAKITLLLWMLRLLSFELKTYLIERHYSKILDYTVDLPDHRLDQATDLFLKLGGGKIIDVPPYYEDGYTLLHNQLAYSRNERLRAVLARGPDLHQLGFARNHTPQKESPTSLAMYSSWAFAGWFRGLVDFEVDLAKFIDQELTQNPMVHAGWEKETLLDLLAYDYEPDLCLRVRWPCSDCKKHNNTARVQPYWRHLLERIKQRIDPKDLAPSGPEVREKGNVDVSSIMEAASNSSDPVHKPDSTGNVPLVDLNELRRDPLWKQDSHGYPTMISIRSDSIYGRDDVVCMDCWLYNLRTGTRSPREIWKRTLHYFDDICDWSLHTYPLSGDGSSEDEYSPFYIHT